MELPQLTIKVLSLATAVERRKAMRTCLERRSFQFVDPISPDAHLPGVDCSANAQITSFGRTLSRAEISCFKSHLQMMRDHSASSTEWMLILEDDVFLDPDLDIQELIKMMQGRNLSYLRLFARTLPPFKNMGFVLGERQLLRFKSDPYGTQAYLINRKACQSFIAATRSVRMPIDDEMGRFWENGLIPYCLFPFPAIERFVASSIQGDRTEGNRRRSLYNLKFVIFRIRSKLQKLVANFGLTLTA